MLLPLSFCTSVLSFHLHMSTANASITYAAINSALIAIAAKRTSLLPPCCFKHYPAPHHPTKHYFVSIASKGTKDAPRPCRVLSLLTCLRTACQFPAAPPPANTCRGTQLLLGAIPYPTPLPGPQPAPLPLLPRGPAPAAWRLQQLLHRSLLLSPASQWLQALPPARSQPTAGFLAYLLDVTAAPAQVFTWS
jgi:hypothetical protein